VPHKVHATNKRMPTPTEIRSFPRMRRNLMAPDYP
jgi:hypothetical protein